MDKVGKFAEIKKMKGVDIYSVIGKFDDDAAISLLASHFDTEAIAPAFKASSPATGELAKIIVTEYR